MLFVEITPLYPGPLIYQKGYLNGNVQVVVVFWGSGTYDPILTSASGNPNIPVNIINYFLQLVGNGALTAWRK